MCPEKTCCSRRGACRRFMAANFRFFVCHNSCRTEMQIHWTDQQRLFPKQPHDWLTTCMELHIQCDSRTRKRKPAAPFAPQLPARRSDPEFSMVAHLQAPPLQAHAELMSSAMMLCRLRCQTGAQHFTHSVLASLAPSCSRMLVLTGLTATFVTCAIPANVSDAKRSGGRWHRAGSMGLACLRSTERNRVSSFPRSSTHLEQALARVMADGVVLKLRLRSASPAGVQNLCACSLSHCRV